MKKLVVLTALTTLIVFGTQAQELHFGAKGGVNFASARGEDTDDLDGRTSFHIGGVLNIGLTEQLAIQPEVLYSGQGYSFVDQDGDNDVNLDYINVPILLDYTVIDGLSIQAGPQVAINIGSKVKFNDEEIDLKDQTKGTSFSGVLGGQYRLPMGLFFQARYALGLTNIPEDDDFEAKNSVISLSVGYFFN